MNLSAPADTHGHDGTACPTNTLTAAGRRLPAALLSPRLLKAGGTDADFRAGIGRAIALGWLWLHESGTYLEFTDIGALL
jgi:hypothetical protein